MYGAPPDFICEKAFRLKLSGNEVYYTACSLPAIEKNRVANCITRKIQFDFLFKKKLLADRVVIDVGPIALGNAMLDQTVFYGEGKLIICMDRTSGQFHRNVVAYRVVLDVGTIALREGLQRPAAAVQHEFLNITSKEHAV